MHNIYDFFEYVHKLTQNNQCQVHDKIIYIKCYKNLFILCFSVKTER